jgi:hypothetical protein
MFRKFLSGHRFEGRVLGFLETNQHATVRRFAKVRSRRCFYPDDFVLPRYSTPQGFRIHRRNYFGCTPRDTSTSIMYARERRARARRARSLLTGGRRVGASQAMCRRHSRGGDGCTATARRRPGSRSSACLGRKEKRRSAGSESTGKTRELVRAAFLAQPMRPLVAPAASARRAPACPVLLARDIVRTPGAQRRRSRARGFPAGWA